MHEWMDDGDGNRNCGREQKNRKTTHGVSPHEKRFVEQPAAASSFFSSGRAYASCQVQMDTEFGGSESCTAATTERRRRTRDILNPA